MLALMLVFSLVMALPVWAQDDGADPVEKAVAYLVLVVPQNEDGGFSNGWTPDSDIVTTADVVVALVSADQDLETLFVDGAANPVDYLAAQVEASSVTAAGSIAKVLTAVIAAGQDPADFGGHNLIDELLATQTEEGVFGSGAFDHCLAMIALQNAAADELPEGTVEALVDAQNEDGGWGFMAGEASDTNTTGLCLQALALTEEAEAVEAGLAYFAAIQNEDGGWPYQSPSDFGTDSDTNSTALIIQALIANGEDLEEWGNPQEWLLSMQNESGSFSFQAAMPGDNVLATVAVIPALASVMLEAK
jgi:hypothetical protein